MHEEESGSMVSIQDVYDTAFMAAAYRAKESARPDVVAAIGCGVA